MIMCIINAGNFFKYKPQALNEIYFTATQKYNCKLGCSKWNICANKLIVVPERYVTAYFEPNGKF